MNEAYMDLLSIFGGYKGDELYDAFENKVLPELANLEKDGFEYDAKAHESIKQLFKDKLKETALTFDITAEGSLEETINDTESEWNKLLARISKLRKAAEVSERSLTQALNSKNPNYKRIEELTKEHKENTNSFAEETYFMARFRKMYELSTIARKLDKPDNHIVLFKGLYLVSSDSLKEQDRMIDSILDALRSS